MPVRNASWSEVDSRSGQNTVIHDYTESVEHDNRRLIGVRNEPEPKWTCADCHISVSRTKDDTLLRNRES